MDMHGRKTAAEREAGSGCRVWFVLALVAVMGCGGSGEAPANPRSEPGLRSEETSRTELLRGHLLFGSEARVFRPCGDDRPDVAVLDGTGGSLQELARALAPEPGAPVYVEIVVTRDAPTGEATAAGSTEAVRVEAVRRAYPTGEGPGCDEDLRFLAYRAFGNEPFWSLSVAPDGAVLSTPGPEGTRRFSILEVDRSRGDERVFELEALQPGGDSLRLVLESEPCVDTMSGARFSLRARVRVGDRILGGCALEGDASLPPPG